MLILAIAFGGAVGALMRYGCSVAAQRLFGSLFPWGTMFVNLAGSLLLGFFATIFTETLVSREVRGFLLVGLFGSFTTFSTLMYESMALLRNREYFQAAWNIGGSIIVGLTFIFIGSIAARAVLRA